MRPRVRLRVRSRAALRDDEVRRAPVHSGRQTRGKSCFDKAVLPHCTRSKVAKAKRRLLRASFRNRASPYFDEGKKLGEWTPLLAHTRM